MTEKEKRTEPKVIRCKECTHEKWCGQIIEIFGRQYHVDFCSYGEPKKTNPVKERKLP